MHGRGLLKKGLLRSIGDGKDTLVWSDNWILDKMPRPPISSQRNMNILLKVSDLIDSHNGKWDAHRIRQLFIEKDAAYILNLKTSRNLKDTHIWGFTKTGTYSSQSGYKLLESLPEHRLGKVTSLSPLERNLWSNLWKLKTVPKIKHFIWKALAGALAVSDRLQYRGIQIDPMCKICGTEAETICHVLFTCPIARQTWDLSHIPPPRTGFSCNSVFLNLHHLLACIMNPNISSNVSHAFPWILWHIWKTRNMFIFEGRRSDAHTIFIKAQEDAKIWLELNKIETQIQPAQTEIFHWSRPSPNFIKCNVSSSWINKNRNCGVSWLARDHMGLVVLHSRRSYSEVKSSFESDLLGIFWAVEGLSNLHFTKIILESSSRQTVQAISYPQQFPLFRNILYDIQHFLHTFEDWRIEFVSVSENRVANSIAESVTKDHRYQSYIARDEPSWLAGLIHSEAVFDSQCNLK